MNKRIICLCAVLSLLLCLTGCEKSQAPYLSQAEKILTVVFNAPGEKLAQAYAAGDEEAQEEAFQEMFSGLVEEDKIGGFAFCMDGAALHRNLYDTGASCEMLQIAQLREMEAEPGNYFASVAVRVSGGRYDGLEFVLYSTIRFSRNGLAEYMDISGNDYDILAAPE